MSFLGTCPHCSNEIPQDRYIGGSAICECGWSDKTSLNRVLKQNERKTIRALVIGALLTVGLFSHLAIWGSYALQIPLVELQELTGTLSRQGYLELADACTALGRYACAKSADTEITTSLNDISGLALRAHLEERLGEGPAALASLTAYFAAGGKDATASVAYGRLLEAAGRNDEALKAYDYAVQNPGELLPVQATTGLVHVLMKQGRYQDALTRITAFHESAGNAVGYLNTELAQLETYLGAQAKTAAKPKGKKAAGAQKRVAAI